MRCLGAALRARGHEVTVLAPSGAGEDRGEVPGYVRLGTTVPVRGNGSTAQVGLSPFIRGAVRRLLATRAFDVVHYHEPLLPTLPRLVLNAYNGVNVGTFHASAEASPAYRAGRPFLSRSFRRLHSCIAVSEPARELAARYFPGAYRIVPNGVDTTRFRPGQEPHPAFRSSGKSTLLFVGRLDRRKGLHTLLTAFATLRSRRSDVRLVVVGDGPLRRRCEAFVSRRRVPDVCFAGFVDAGTLPNCYAAADVFCAPATGQESFGIVLLEAMASGVPVMASAIPGFSRVVADGRSGLLLPPRDAGAWAAALTAVLDDRQRLSRMGEAGMAEAHRYDWDRIAEEVLDVYAEACERRRAGVVAADLGPAAVG
jgi:phosphatidylinositol alpha-mannosyltransferase